MPIDLHDTIAAVSSPPGAAARGIIRISGTQTEDVVAGVYVSESQGGRWQAARVPRRYPGTMQIPELGIPLPVTLMYWPTPRSYTGQPMAELHLPGSPPLLDAALEQIFRCGARPAHRGEFTLRAWLAGRIDLLQVEAVLGVIQATDHAELQRALTQLGGGITERVTAIRSELLALLSDLEAGLDFVDEDIEFISRQQIGGRLHACRESLGELCGDTAVRLPSGWRRRVVLAGLPNAGKSTLFNRLTGQCGAIVSPVPGTTRDYLTATIRLWGTEIELVDTAGWEEASDSVTGRAQELRCEQFASADLIVWCRSAVLPESHLRTDTDLLQEVVAAGPQVLSVLTQSDLAGGASVFGGGAASRTARDVPCVSSVTGEGISVLLEQIRTRLLAEAGATGELLGSTAARCRDSLTRTLSALDSAISLTGSQPPSGDELIALELRAALHELATLRGAVLTDDILDQIFSRFCIGK